MKDGAFSAAFKRSPVSEITCYGNALHLSLGGLTGITQLHLVYNSMNMFSDTNADLITSLPSLSVLSLGGSVNFDMSALRKLSTYIAETKTLEALEISDVNKNLHREGRLLPRAMVDPRAPQGISNYFTEAEYKALHDGILNNDSLTYLNLHTTQVIGLDEEATKNQIALLQRHVGSRFARLLNTSLFGRLLQLL
ncbi:MAG: hypothetical protein LCH26_01625 [Proteobacteria bacterium]|nr:hypothetical protein [Pseudomonadota bacterium]